jgi:Uma2 family endonuclease
MLPPDLLEPERARKIARSEYDRLVEIGLFGDERVELLHGVIVSMSPNDPPHASPIEMLTELLVPALVGRARVRVQLPLVAADESEPEPDVAVVPIASHAEKHPDRALLVIEVADTSLKKDRLVKGPLYALSGCREYWIVNVAGRSIEVHRGPTADGWTSITRHVAGDTIRPEAFPDLPIAVADVFR